MIVLLTDDVALLLNRYKGQEQVSPYNTPELRTVLDWLSAECGQLLIAAQCIQEISNTTPAAERHRVLVCLSHSGCIRLLHVLVSSAVEEQCNEVMDNYALTADKRDDVANALMWVRAILERCKQQTDRLVIALLTAAASE